MDLSLLGSVMLDYEVVSAVMIKSGSETAPSLHTRLLLLHPD
jgi:hypothetical protein